MDVDTELDANLLQQFSCLGTTDKDVLISQFQKVLGHQLNATECAFYLDMNNWNLQAAVCSYFDCDAAEALPKMSFIKDVTIGEGEAVPPETKFVKTWKIQNSGDKRWPRGCYLQFVSGDHLGHINWVFVESLGPMETTDVSVEMHSPKKPGIYQGQWRMTRSDGQYFGDIIWVIITVQEGGLLGLTQQMDAFNELGSPPRAEALANPFAAAPLRCHGPDQPSPLQIGDLHFVSDCPASDESSRFRQQSIASCPSDNGGEFIGKIDFDIYPCVSRKNP